MPSYNILSIDGGGMRGVIPLSILSLIEDRLDLSISDHFDLIAGTSTGGLIACALATPSEQDDRIPKHTSADLFKIYRTRGNEIFERRRKRQLKYWRKSKYKSSGFAKVLDEVLGKTTIGQCTTGILVPTYNIIEDKPVIFSSREAYGNSVPGLVSDTIIKLKDICLSSAAAPTYFVPHNISLNSRPFSFIDGGVFCNNPSMSALLEVANNADHAYYLNRRTANAGHQGEPLKINLLSLSTGYTHTKINHHKVGGMREYQWATPIINTMMNGSSQFITELLRGTNLSMQALNYLRIEIDLSNLSETAMDITDTVVLDEWVEEARVQFMNDKQRIAKLDSFLHEVKSTQST